MNQENSQRTSNSVLVLGGGIAGIKASYDLAEAGRQVYLLEKKPALGGFLPLLDRQFPTNDCNICYLSPDADKAGGARTVQAMPLTKLVSLEGQAGDFNAKVLTSPRFINVDRCNACGACLAACPQGAISFTPGLDTNSPTCLRYPQATPQAFAIDMSKCDRCGECIKVCAPEAIDLDQKEVEQSLEVGSVVLASGGELWDPAPMEEWYGHGRFPDVLTSLEFEQLMSAAGPTGGKFQRPSDGRHPKRIGWIQCAGSRTTKEGGNSYCSSICCMISMKEAIWAMEHFEKDLEATVFFMDMRPMGKDYELYYQRAKNELGVNFVRCRPHTVDYKEETGDLRMSYVDDHGSLGEVDLDLVVLGVGFCAASDAQEQAAVLGIELGSHHFVKADELAPVSTTRPGVYACGMALGPQDIPGSLTQASAAGCMASADLAAPRALRREDDLPKEKDFSGQDPRIGVFFVDWGRVVQEVVDSKTVEEATAKLDGVVHVERLELSYGQDGLAALEKAIGEHKINRVVVAGYSPRTHGRIFAEAIRKAGLNRAYLEMANIREQDALVHHDDPKAATDKAVTLVRTAVAGVRQAKPTPSLTLPFNPDAVVVGGGVAGMSAALGLAGQGGKVYLVERSRELGGLANQLARTLDGRPVAPELAELVEKVKANPNIEILTDTLVVDHKGQVGSFITGVQTGPGMFYRQINHGVTILATGARRYEPTEYLYGQDPKVMTQLEMEKLLASGEGGDALDTVVMIQCVGSRNDDNPTCGRICCRSAVKNALWIKEQKPDAQVFVLYRDMRMPFTSEDAYRQAREEGVLFVRYSPDAPPRVSKDGDTMEVIFKDHILDRELSVEPSALVLSVPQIAADEDTEELCEIFRLQQGPGGFLLEDHPKVKPVDTPAPGVFAAGSVLAPASLAEARTQGLAAAGRALTMVSQMSLVLDTPVAKVNGDRCAACLICVRTCPYGIPYINADGYSEIDPAQCLGCGVCAAECPAQAIQLPGYEDDRMLSRTEALLEGVL
ncbi:MAG: FAD-dependent oxidoreductase [Proteobacteria bacterium]|nr:FAD-dependent oxidoreductase [Pseudomonadota bacterium]MBU4383339.1 FAD-dependent oxidoreductase [Pseudomonadota bacterium]MCG2764378.1 FAD-dependent oxidoreductase [Desulfarculaceae bacterium]